MIFRASWSPAFTLALWNLGATGPETRRKLSRLRRRTRARWNCLAVGQIPQIAARHGSNVLPHVTLRLESRNVADPPFLPILQAIDMRAVAALEQHVQRCPNLEPIQVALLDDMHVSPGVAKVLKGIQATDPAEPIVLVDIVL